MTYSDNYRDILLFYIFYQQITKYYLLVQKAKAERLPAVGRPARGRGLQTFPQYKTVEFPGCVLAHRQECWSEN